MKYLLERIFGVVFATSLWFVLATDLAHADFPAFGYHGFFAGSCIRSTPDEACRIQDGTQGCGNVAFGRPPAGVGAHGFHPCSPAGAHACLWQEPGGAIVPNGIACKLPNWCPANATQSGGNCVCLPGTVEENSNCVPNWALAKNNGVPDDPARPCPVGNPCHPATGNKVERQLVYRGLAGFELALTFNSFDVSAARFGTRWRDSFDRRVLLAGTTAVVLRPDGRALRFSPSGGAWVTDADTADRLVELQNPPGTRIGWEFTAANADEIENYTAAGALLTIKARSGLTQTLTYSDGTGGPNGGFVLDANGNPTGTPLPAGLLIRAADHFGRVLAFGYNAASRIVKLTDPAAAQYRFAYNATGDLTSIIFPGPVTRTYLYNEPAHTGGADLPTALTGIVDENGDRFATFQYDAQQRVLSTEHAGGAMRHTLSYGAGTTSVTGPLGAVRDYNFTTLFDVHKTSGIAGPACPDCGPASRTFDANGNVATQVDWNGNRTDYGFDLTRNLETSRTEGLTSGGATTPQTRTISTQWHGTFRLPTGIAEPLRITTFIYDPDGTQCGARGALCSKSIQATTDANGSAGFSATPSGAPRAWTYTYNSNGSVLTVNGPRTDASDVTTYTYYPNNDADLGKRGNVETITNAAGHQTSITAYNAHGQPLTIVDPNGLTTTLTYDSRQRLKTRTVGTELTTYDYDNVGSLTKITLPDGSFLSYIYDDAHRLTEIQDNLGNRITYTLDAMGNRTLEEVRDPASQLAQTRSRVISSINRLFRELGSQSQTTEYTYDDQGNVLTVKDPLDRTTTNQYDALNRLKQVTSPAPISAVTQYAYNGLDALTQVTDPRNLVTGYTVDGLGNLTQQASPDTGSTVNSYDAAGNLLTQTDAKNQFTTYAYDALNRVTLITFHDGSKQVYAYDLGANAIGRLSSITERNPADQVTSVIAYAYDQHGRVTSETRTVAGAQYVLAYRYDSSGRLDQLTYPSGRLVNYSFDSLGRISGLTTTKSGEPAQTVVSSVAYHPFGGVKSYMLGAAHVYTRSIDLDGRVAAYNLGSQSFAIGYDAASRIEFISEVGNPPNSNSYGYDNLDRLTSAVLPGTPYAYTYDAVGNRSSRTAGSSTDTYAYPPTSNRIASITPTSGPVRNFSFDPNGSTTADGLNTYVYDMRGRMTQATSTIGATNYQVNALGQRIRKTNTLGDTVFHYDTGGRLIAETGPSGTLKRELVYLGDIPVGVILAQAAPANISFRAAASATAAGVTPAFRSANSAATTGSTLTITKPSGVAANDVLIASIAVSPSSAAITPPAGWTLIRRLDNANTTSNSLAVYYKAASGSEPASYAWGVSGGTFTVGGIQAFTGIDTASPIDAENGQNTASGTSHAAPGVTSTVANAMVVSSHAYASSRTWSPPSGMTESFDRPSGANSATGLSIEGTRALQALAGPSGNKAATAAGNADVGNAHLLALRPASANLSIATPAGTTAGDVMIAVIGFNNASAAIIPPSGWTLVRRVNNSTTTSNALAVYRKTAAAGEPGSHVWGVAGGTFIVGGIQSFSGVDPANPVDAEAGQSTASGTNHDTPSIITSTADAMLVTSHTYASSRSWTPQAGLTESFERLSGSASATGQSITGTRQTQAAPGASGTKRSTAASSADVGNTHILALRRFVPPPPLHLIYVDHLNTPRLVVNQQGQAVWRWDQLEPFGENLPDENPGSLGAFEFPLRFPGQYADKETLLHYNFFRDYDPSLGRYAESDPIGLLAGPNTYLYTADPLIEVDPFGLNRSTGGYRRSAFQGPGTVTYFAVRISGVCGAQGGISFPDEWVFFGTTWNFQTPCNQHDYCYTMGCNSRRECDDVFYNSLMSQCQRIPPSSAMGFARSMCRTQGMQYYTAVVLFGAPNYNSIGCIGCPTK